jgi:putative redox protein
VGQGEITVATTFRATVEHVNHTTSKVTVRTHTLLVDRGVAKGGFDRGPAGGEYMLVALGGCFTSHLLAAIRAREAGLTNVKVDVTGTLDGSPERFTSFTLDVSADCQDQELARRLVVIAARACQVVTTLRLAADVTIQCNGSRVDLEAVAAA